ncbi:MAG: cyclic pyranopterin monophosphate synthase MoaC [Peptoniphilaceae bacterium]|uniref:cyclic pyranopterin monophosphate synthase MoaC n=1 Tax=Parvimonas sp. TaxID=1944660 RepID=UPI0025E6DB1D|nr:cyclic pyranopterin monophosphate synthase MoaC [Parvimonas sp.]MCI5998078.1 cyclic pyranopterin monophosphate synthase MoaC [Parvimonas sp.]MDD7764150.1 cyclic pyranopterin monophosphate synthase MoaC [Peptoniphilaceae bacterium]MDY3050735.1 cyclic pyranopterin monophosphate synthase MoaC [Parvimonas sp.]
MNKKLTHLNEQGRARMVDVSEKNKTKRIAKATATVKLNEETFNSVVNLGIKKGDVLAVSQVAGIMGAKNTSDIIPMCHPIMLSGVDIEFILKKELFEIQIIATTKCVGETGVEMEALSAVSIASLTIYDMCKALQRDIEITDIKLLEKSGGKSGNFKRNEGM